MKRMWGNLILGAVMLAGAMRAPATSVTTNAFMDAFVTTGASGSLANSNFGSAGLLGVAASGLAQGEFQSVMQFDLSGVYNSFNSQYGAGQWTVQSVTLKLSATPANNGILNTSAAGQFHVYFMANNLWSEGNGTPALPSPSSSGITYNSLQTLLNPSLDQDMGTFSYNGATSGAFVYSLAQAPGFLTDLMSGGKASVRMSAADSSVSYLFNSKNFGNSANWPQLTIVAVPEPGTLALLGVGAALVAGRRMRRGRGGK